MSEALTIKIKTLTPLWTGGANGKMDRLHETGLIGSLRWWYEAIVRGLGGDACDPIEHACKYDDKKANNGLCNACQLFGATGWRRRFRLVVQDIQMSSQSVTHPMRAGRSYVNRKGKQHSPTWYFQNPPKAGQFTMRLYSLHPEFGLEIMQGLIQFITDWSALGARTQMGFGITEMVSKRLATNPFNKLQLTGSDSSSNLPSLQNMFFARIQETHATDQDTFNLKYDLRRLFANDEDVRHFIMGMVRKKDRIGAKIFMSRPYADNLIRVWGWVPEESSVWNNKWKRETVLDQINKHLNANYQLKIWREFNSTRDTYQQYNNVPDFLNSLWEGKE